MGEACKLIFYYLFYQGLLKDRLHAPNGKIAVNLESFRRARRKQGLETFSLWHL